MKLKCWYGIIRYSNHWQYQTTITHGGCKDAVLVAGNGNTLEAIENVV